MDLDAARQALVDIMRRMQTSGLNRGTSGNASIRVPGGILVTPSGIPPDALTPGSMVFVDDDGSADPAGLRPSTEHRMHLRILLQRPDAQAVVHCHSRHATILACCGIPIEPLHYMILVAGASRLDVAPYATFGTDELADAVVATMGQGRACLLANHGQVAIGASLTQALAIAEEVEEQSAITYGALLLGRGNRLTEAQLDASVERFKTYGQ
jgi:L-fuculose-phosphate aldolase